MITEDFVSQRIYEKLTNDFVKENADKVDELSNHRYNETYQKDFVKMLLDNENSFEVFGNPVSVEYGENSLKFNYKDTDYEINYESFTEKCLSIIATNEDLSVIMADYRAAELYADFTQSQAVEEIKEVNENISDIDTAAEPNTVSAVSVSSNQADIESTPNYDDYYDDYEEEYQRNNKITYDELVKEDFVNQRIYEKLTNDFVKENADKIDELSNHRNNETYQKNFVKMLLDNENLFEVFGKPVSVEYGENSLKFNYKDTDYEINYESFTEKCLSQYADINQSQAVEEIKSFYESISDIEDIDVRAEKFRNHLIEKNDEISHNYFQKDKTFVNTVLLEETSADKAFVNSLAKLSDEFKEAVTNRVPTEVPDADISSVSVPENSENSVTLSQSRFIEIVSDILSKDEVVFNAHQYSDEQNYRLEINSGIDEVFSEVITGKRDVGYAVSEMSELWNSYQNDEDVKKYIQDIVAENVDISLTSNQKNIEQIKKAAKEENISFMDKLNEAENVISDKQDTIFSPEEEIIANQLSFEDLALAEEPIAALTEDEPVQASFDDEISSVINEKNLEAVQNIEVGDEITLKDRAYTVNSINNDFMMAMTPKDVSEQEMSLYKKSYIGDWRKQLVEEAENTPIIVLKPDKEKRIENENINEIKTDVPKEKSEKEIIQNAENRVKEDLLNALNSNRPEIRSMGDTVLNDKLEGLVQDLKNDRISPINAINSMREAGFEFNDTKITFNATVEKTIPENNEINNNGKQADSVENRTEEPEKKSSYFRITDEHLGEGSKREKFKKNIDAISTLKKIENEERSATPEEQEIMSGYVGWGGLQEAFDSKDSAWHKEYYQLKHHLTEDEYEAALSTVNDAFYTSPVITQAIYEGLENIGFTGGEILEPSMGVGNFFGTMPDKIRDNSNLSGVEIDSISGRIAQQLYPEANIAINGFEKVKPNRGSFDAVIGNVPFGNYGVNDKNKAYNGLLIHDYFFAKSIDTVRPGGVVAFVTSSGTLDKEDTKVRQTLAQKAELLGAVRLPNNAFQKNAGTQTTTDIIFLKKRDKELKISEMPKDKSCDWVYTKENADGYRINSYFADNPDMVLGKLSDNGRFGSIVCNPIQGADLKEQLHTAMKNIKGEYKPLEFQQELDEHNSEKFITATPDIENLTYTVVNDRLYFRVEDNLIPLKESEQHGILAERRKAMCGLGETTRNLLKAQVENRPDMEIKKLQSELNIKYDSFVKKYGRINPTETPNERNSTGVSRKMPNVTAFRNDVRLPLLQSLEKMKNGQFIGKAEIFTERTIRPRQLAEHVETAQDALVISMSEKGKIDFDYMEKLTGFEKDKLIDDLHGDIYPVPELSTLDNTVYQTNDEYLSGNIYKKIDEAEAKLADNPAYAENITALKQVIPPPLKATEIDMQLGMTWIDPKVIQQFMYDTFETPSSLREYDANALYPNKNAITVEYSGSGKGSWKINNAGLDRSVKATKNFGTKDLNAYELLEKILNSKPVAITQTFKDSETGKNKTVILEKQTKAAEDKAKQINAAFKKWVFEEPDRRNELVKTYNRKFNCIRPREYDGSHLNFFGSNPQITLKPHQKNAVAHALFGGNTLFAHQVGAGKTFEMIATAMEGKRLGLHNKSMFVVPNHLTEQIGSDFMKLYPNANILVAKPDDFSPQKRRQMCARIATGNFDAVIIGHSQLIKIPLSPKREEEFIRKQIKEVTLSLEAAQETDSKSYTVKQLEATKKRLRDRLEKLTNGTVKDKAVTFEELGVDKLFVDEAHEFKNLYVSTKMENVSGLSTNADVQKTQDLYMKCQYLDETTGSKGVVFSTGTPVTNALSEMYTTMKYLQADLLKEAGLESFDSWAGNFTRKSTEAEISPSGSDWRMKTRLKFTNVPELVTMFKECADIKMADQLNLNVPECSKNIVSVEPTELQKNIVKKLGERAENISTGQVSRTEDNMLVVTSDGRKLGLDQRMYDLTLPDEPQSKLNACVSKVHDIWESTADKKSTQLIFCDLGVPQSKEDIKKNGRRFDAYSDIRQKLIDKGIPDKEIAFIHDAASETEKAKLFAKVRSGDVRVLIGSTQKMGAGTNVQDKLIALHDLDCPWRPADLTQRLGRMVRQGNENNRVHNFRYVTKGTFDAYLYQMVEKKQQSISQIFTSKSIGRTCDDIDDMAVDFMQVKMAAIGDERIRRQMELKEDIRSLNMLRNTYLDNRYELEDNIKHLPERIEKAERLAKNIALDTKMIQSYVPPKDIDGNELFEMKINGQTVTDKKLAGEMFKSAMTVAIAKNPEKPTEIAEYKGFKLAVSYDAFTMVHKGILKSNEVSYPFELGSSESGNIKRIDNVIASVPKRADAVCNDIQQMKQELADSIKEINAPFEHEAELADKTRELDELTAAINEDRVNGKTAPEQPENTAPDTAEPSVTDMPDNTQPTVSDKTAAEPTQESAVPQTSDTSQKEQSETLNIKWKQYGREMRITFDSGAEKQISAYADNKLIGQCTPDELTVTSVKRSLNDKFPEDITKCVKPLNLAFNSKMAMHIKNFAYKVKELCKKLPKRENTLFSKKEIMSDKYAPTSSKKETQAAEQEH